MTGAMDGKTALITGATGGIGRATAVLLAGRGARIALVDRDQSVLDAVLDELVEASVPRSALNATAADVTDSEAVAAYVAETVSQFGSLDVLVNNAGIEGFAGPIEDCPEDAFDAVMATNVKGVWLNMKHAVHAMRGNAGGVIINLASGAAIVGAAGLAAYSASKHAVAGLTRTAAIELAPHGIRVNAVCPGPVRTRMMTSIEEQLDTDESAFVSDIPMRRYGTPDEVAAAIAYLAGDDAAYVTGALLAIDGGSTAR